MNTTEIKGSKAFMIARVSDPSQRDALPAQELRLNDYAKRHELDAELLSFDETAYKSDRQKFQEIVDRIASYPDFCVVVFDKVDRFTRDSSSEVVRVLKSLVKDGKIELHFPSDNLFIHKNSPAADKTRLGMGMVFGEYYSAAISDNVKRKIQQKLHEGEWPGKAPIGFLNVDTNDESGKLLRKDVVPDPTRQPFIVKIYELRLQGVSYRMIAHQMRAEGLTGNSKNARPISASMIENILKNPFYYGVMLWDGKEYPHRYQTLISKQTFKEAQKITESRNNGGAKPRSDVKRVFTFNGIMTCKRCGCSISSYEKKGFVYMQCSKAKYNCRQTHGKEAEAEVEIKKIIEATTVDNDTLDQILQNLAEEHNNEQLYYKNVAETTRREISRLKGRLDALYEDRLDGRISLEDYDKMAQKNKEEAENLERKLVQITSDDKSFTVDAAYLLKLSRNAGKLFESSKAPLKNRLLKIILSNLEFEDKILFYKRRAPFDVISECLLSSNWLPILVTNFLIGVMRDK
jgi:DNA invertase Pin-like site-specific DNA recombinase